MSNLKDNIGARNARNYAYKPRGAKNQVPIGYRSHMLVVTGQAEPIPIKTGSYRRAVTCLCDCGVICVKWENHVFLKIPKSCGCLKHRGTQTTHGMSYSQEWRAWANMKVRCTNTAYAHYADYGGRGISVYQEWKSSFEAFFAHIGPSPGKGYSVDRIDVNGNYEPGNVKWSTQREQTQNTRKSRIYELDGERCCVSEWVRRLDISRHALTNWLKKGRSFPDAIALCSKVSR